MLFSTYDATKIDFGCFLRFFTMIKSPPLYKLTEIEKYQSNSLENRYIHVFTYIEFKNMTKISFKLFIPAKTRTEANSGSKPELRHSKKCISGTFFFSHILLFIIIVYCTENFIIVSMCSL